MARINQIITLGIGTPSDIAGFITLGLLGGEEPPPPSPSDTNNALTSNSAMTGGGDIEEGIG